MKKIIILLSLLFSFSLIGCNSKNNNDTQTSGDIDKNTTKEYASPYTGEKVTKETLNKTPYMVIVENSTFARPQSGLSEADIIYETSAEGGIPRFLALFHKNTPEKIGPVRSVRPYFLTLTKEHSLAFGHCGGSSDALSEIDSDSTSMSLNEMKNPSSYFRDSDRKAPHNLYTTPKHMLDLVSSKGFNTPPKESFKFKENALSDANEKATEVYIAPNKIYNTTYKFKDNKYTKYMDGELATDSNNNFPLTFSNVLIQKTNITLGNDGSHLDIDIIGTGTGYLLSNGKKIDITWKKDSEYSGTKFYDLSGKEIELSQGNTIINIVDNKSTIDIKS
ncbi:MAG: DUF3048 domain-containing protein [Clostridium sp.]|uniref:DUF3048 domain-containing protein n=1 Tax=Clostridium sp. TaxID=1506 RepID=UPI003F399769